MQGFDPQPFVPIDSHGYVCERRLEVGPSLRLQSSLIPLERQEGQAVQAEPCGEWRVEEPCLSSRLVLAPRAT